MGEWADDHDRRETCGTRFPTVEMQSEEAGGRRDPRRPPGRSAGHQFTASQGLLLMIPNIIQDRRRTYADGAARRSASLTAQALSIFGDHSDVMACRAVYAMLCSASVQEVQDFALIAQAATLQDVPVLHFFDGFRTSHEVDKISEVACDGARTDRRGPVTRTAGRCPRLAGPARHLAEPDVYFQGVSQQTRYYA